MNNESTQIKLAHRCRKWANKDFKVAMQRHQESILCGQWTNKVFQL
jgi:hypothetical protein